ncbi:hypothetical protein [Armatimonas sp.]|uniref:hypothetical protein n=1 Tax=Armatimonas sp. TaxID=1872638 RepID=UPI0037520A67
MKEKVNPLVLIVVGVVVLAGVVLLIWKTSQATPNEAPGIIVKPADPNDPKYKPDPRLNLGGGGA